MVPHQNQYVPSPLVRPNYKKCFSGPPSSVSIVFDELKKKKNLPASSVFQISSPRNICLFIFLNLRGDTIIIYECHVRY